MNKSPNIILNNHLKRYNSPIKNEMQMLASYYLQRDYNKMTNV